MIVKLIRCKVTDNLRAKFSDAQRAWAALSTIEGFMGQMGGWDTQDDNFAVIIAYWRDQGCYDQFMRVTHDPIFENSRQADTYQSCEVDRWEAQFDIAGEVGHVRDAMANAELIRLARCKVYSDRVEHFVTVQQTVWNPAMANSGGMLAGVFSQHMQDKYQYLVCTLWQSITAHDNYRTQYLSKLKDQAEVAIDVAQLEGYIVHVKPTWRVLGDR